MKTLGNILGILLPRDTRALTDNPISPHYAAIDGFGYRAVPEGVRS